MWSRWLHPRHLQLLWQAQAPRGQLQEESLRGVPKRPIPVEVPSTLLGQLSGDSEELWSLKADVHLHSVSGLRSVHRRINTMVFANFIDRDTATSLALKPLDDKALIIVTPDGHHICTFGVFEPSFPMQDKLGQQVEGKVSLITISTPVYPLLLRKLWLHEHDPNLHIRQATWWIRDIPSGANKPIHLLGVVTFALLLRSEKSQVYAIHC